MITGINRFRRRLAYVARRLSRRLLLVTFYPRHRGDTGLLGLHSGLLFVNGAAQRILRLNARATFPVHFTSRVTNPSAVTLGEGVARYLAISGGCYLQAANGIAIGDQTMIAPGVKIISANHDASHRDQHVVAKPVKIGKNCWLGANVIVLPGREIGDGTIVGAGSVVSSDLPSGVVAFGVPAQVRHYGGHRAEERE